ncbi:MAG: excalibur calcium-binding domain-containing protein [Alphaproteobacteria bacterium]|nr:excalibur calcium-binding domain-containing protein [Alphaproteobacteria bacterium]
MGQYRKAIRLACVCVVLRALVPGFILLAAGGGQAETGTWRGLVVAPETRCSPYDRERDYRYSQSVEQTIVARMGAVYGPYTGRYFASTRETDIEHIVATSEAHDSGLCARNAAARARFASDPRNLTLASVRVNRHQKQGKDAAEWLPDRNRCWFVGRIIEVRRTWNLTIDRREAEAIDAVLAGCDRIPDEPVMAERAAAAAPRTSPRSGTPLDLWDDNENGRITCREARRHGIAPVRSDHAAYRFMRDGDGDGVVCERGW